MAKQINNLLIPNVSKVGNKKGAQVNKNKLNQGQISEFKELLGKQIDHTQKQHGIKLSMHAARRLNERQLSVDGDEYFKIKDAISKLKTKGGQDSLVITGQGAYIVDVKNNTIVTAMDRSQMAENVFTKIDSTIFVD